MASKRVTPELSVDVQGLKALQKHLKAAADGTDKRLAKGLKQAGSIAADKAKQNAEWSEKIASSVKTSVSRASVSITAGGKKAPQAISYETHGKHPVFAKGPRKGWKWNKKPLKRPFLKPAADDRSTLTKVATAIGEAIADIGSR